MTTYRWIGSSGSYGVAANWSPAPPAGFPGLGDSVMFDGTNAYTVTIAADYPDLAGFTLANPNATVKVYGSYPVGWPSAFVLSAGGLYLQASPTYTTAFGLSASATLTGGAIVVAGGGTSLLSLSGSAEFGAGMTFNVLEGTGSVAFAPYSSTAEFINRGHINAVNSNFNAATLEIKSDSQYATFTNTGVITADNNNTVNIAAYRTNNSGVISVNGIAKLTTTTYKLTNDGAIRVGLGASWTAKAMGLAGSIVNNGVIATYGGDVDLAGGLIAVGGTGWLEIHNGGTLRFWGEASTQDVRFMGAGQARINSSFANKLTGFSIGDSVALESYFFVAGAHMAWQSTAGGVQTFALEDSANNVLTTLKFAGHYSASMFQVAGGTQSSSVISYGCAAPPAPARCDFSADGFSDILFRNDATGDLGYHQMTDGATLQSWRAIGGSSTAYRVAGVGDFNGDGVADILFRNTTAGDLGYYQMNGAGSLQAWRSIGGASTAFGVAGIGDFNGDGVSDILFRAGNGDLGYYQMNSAGGLQGWRSIAGSSTAFAVAGIGDFNGDGVSDILFRAANGDLGYYQMNSAGTLQGWHSIGGASTAFGVAGIGDFNGDSVSDILFRAGNGDLGYYQMNSAGGLQAWRSIGGSSILYNVAGIADYNGDGVSDILWRNAAAGDIGAYLMNSDGSLQGWHAIGGSSTAFGIPA